MKEVTIDFAELKDEQEIHKLLNEAVFHIDFYGHNLNALHDTITGLADRPYIIRFKNVKELHGVGNLATMLEILLMECSRVEKTDQTITFYFED